MEVHEWKGLLNQVVRFKRVNVYAIGREVEKAVSAEFPPPQPPIKEIDTDALMMQAKWSRRIAQVHRASRGMSLTEAQAIVLKEARAEIGEPQPDPQDPHYLQAVEDYDAELKRRVAEEKGKRLLREAVLLGEKTLVEHEADNTLDEAVATDTWKVWVWLKLGDALRDAPLGEQLAAARRHLIYSIITASQLQWPMVLEAAQEIGHHWNGVPIMEVNLDADGQPMPLRAIVANVASGMNMGLLDFESQKVAWQATTVAQNLAKARESYLVQKKKAAEMEAARKAR